MISMNQLMKNWWLLYDIDKQTDCMCIANWWLGCATVYKELTRVVMNLFVSIGVLTPFELESLSVTRPSSSQRLETGTAKTGIWLKLRRIVKLSYYCYFFLSVRVLEKKDWKRLRLSKITVLWMPGIRCHQCKSFKRVGWTRTWIGYNDFNSDSSLDTMTWTPLSASRLGLGLDSMMNWKWLDSSQNYYEKCNDASLFLLISSFSVNVFLYSIPQHTVKYTLSAAMAGIDGRVQMLARIVKDSRPCHVLYHAQGKFR